MWCGRPACNSAAVCAANTVTVGWLSNNMSADHEEVHVPVKKAKPKQTKVVTFWPKMLISPTQSQIYQTRQIDQVQLFM